MDMNGTVRREGEECVFVQATLDERRERVERRAEEGHHWRE